MKTHIMQYVVRHIGWLACLSALVLPEVGLAACAGNEIEEPPIGAMAAPVCVPRDDFTLIGSMGFTPNAQVSDSGNTIGQEMYQGARWITANQENVGTLGLTSQQVSNAIRRFPRNASYVFAQYSQETSSGRITVERVEKTPNGVLQVYQADFTPWSGRLWKAQGKYRAASEISSGASGYNPFAYFEGAPGDLVFHNLSFSALLVAVGHAMRHYGASVGYIAVDKLFSSTITNTKSSAWGFKKSSTTTTTVDAVPVWYLATPMEASLDGQQTAICVINFPGGGCDDPAHVAYSGISVTLEGLPATLGQQVGNMPVSQQQVGQQSSSDSGWTIGNGLGSLLGSSNLFGTGYSTGTTGNSGVMGNGGVMPINPLAALNATNNGVLPEPAAAPNSLAQSVQNGLTAAHIDPAMGASGSLAGDAQLWYGSCPPGQTVAQCQSQGLDPGTTWRPDSYVEYNATAAMRQRYNDCVQQGLSGAAAEQCAAPQTQAIVP